VHQTRRHDPRAAKQRDIARAILPSASRKGARKALDRVRRTHRRAVTQHLGALRDIRVGPDPVDIDIDVDVTTFDLELLPEYPLTDHRDEVSLRRAYDKVAPLLRWAVKEVDGMPLDAARAHLLTVLPHGLIGSHALGHVEWGLGWDPWMGWIEEPRRSRAEVRVAAARSIGRWALEHGYHRSLNVVVRSLYRDEGSAPHAGRLRRSRDRRWRLKWSMAPARPLEGWHDLPTWSAHIAHLCDGFRPGPWPAQLDPFRHLGHLAELAVWATLHGWRPEPPP